MLHTGLGDIIRFVKESCPACNVAVLTNGTLLHREDVAAQVREADVLKVSVDAGSADVFAKINRPCGDLSFAEIICGLGAFREGFRHQFWVEVFLVPGLNDTPAGLEKIREILIRLDPQRIQLNTLDRPGTEAWVTAVARERLEAIAAGLPNAEILRHYDSSGVDAAAGSYGSHGCPMEIRSRIISTIKRRPCTSDDISQLLGLERHDVQRHLDGMLAEGAVTKERMPRGTFYLVA